MSELLASDSPLLVKNDKFQRAFQALLAISAPSQTQDAFLRRCVEQISTAYGSRYAFIGMFQDMSSRSHIQTISCFADGQLTDNMVYPLCGSPCQQVLKRGELYVASGLMDQYPDDDLLIEMGLQSYYGSVLKDSKGEAIGLVVICDTEPMDLDDWNYPLLQLFADRISHELERSLIEQELRLSSSVFQNSHDIVLIVRNDWHIIKANRTFETMTGWTEEEARGQHIFLLRSDWEADDFYRQLTIELLKTGFWSGELLVKPKNGKVFPVDCTLKGVVDPATGENKHYIMIFSDISERKYAEQRIKRLAYYDTGTDLPNRTHFQDKLKQVLSAQRDQDARFALLFMDLDGFKAVNDRMGHASGDILLRMTADRLRTCTGGKAYAARLGGDEFAVVLQPKSIDVDVVAKSGEIARDILSSLAKPYEIEGETISISASVGIALYPEHGEDIKGLLRNADLATYHAKAQGRNRFEFFHDALCEKAENEATLMMLMNKGLKKDQFFMVYQSKHSARDGQMVGAEALLRWRLDGETVISPAQFIPIAEETGQICELGHFVLKSVFQQLSTWQSVEQAPDIVSINLSGRQLMAAGFMYDLENLLQVSGVDPKRIEFEITETWLMEDPAYSAKLLTRLKDLGFSLSIDDFGVAYSSMNYLRHFPIDTLKIDRSFIRDILSDKSATAIISAIIAMGHSLGLKVLAEGVETKEQLDLLSNLGCDEIQGYYFSKPIEAHRLVSKSTSNGLRIA
ncbi:MAG: EAL domain-containing protein [Cohaesibacter sp.]|nr:EAL domain-containing protein [Cohaesibacter sp.]